MLAKAEGKFIRGSGRKIRQVIDLIRGMDAVEAVALLKFVNKRPTYYVTKVLESAVANAKHKARISGQGRKFLGTELSVEYGGGSSLDADLH